MPFPELSPLCLPLSGNEMPTAGCNLPGSSPTPETISSWTLCMHAQFILPFLFISLPHPIANPSNLCSALELSLSQWGPIFEAPPLIESISVFMIIFAFLHECLCLSKLILIWGAPYPNSWLLQVTYNFFHPFPSRGICQFHKT